MITYEFMELTHWFATGYAQPVAGNLANNSSVRVKRV